MHVNLPDLSLAIDPFNGYRSRAAHTGKRDNNPPCPITPTLTSPSVPIQVIN